MDVEPPDCALCGVEVGTWEAFCSEECRVIYQTTPYNLSSRSVRFGHYKGKSIDVVFRRIPPPEEV